MIDPAPENESKLAELVGGPMDGAEMFISADTKFRLYVEVTRQPGLPSQPSCIAIYQHTGGGARWIFDGYVK